MPTVTIPSNRIYMDELAPESADALRTTRFAYSRGKELLYNLYYNGTFLGEKPSNAVAYLKAWFSEEMGLSPQDYYITSLHAHVSGMVKSQKELQSLRETEYRAKCEARESKLKSLEKELTACRKAKENLILYSKALKEERKAVLKVPRTFSKVLPKGKRRDGEAVYKFELWIDKRTKRLKQRIALIKEKSRKEERMHGDGKPPARATFGGGKKAYRLKDTTGVPTEKWHEARDFARDHVILLAGRFDAPCKNWTARYVVHSHTMEITLMDLSVLRLKNVTFPYRGDELEAVLTHKKEKGWSVAYWLDFRKDRDGREYFLIKASFDVRNDRINTYTGNGLIGIDLNLDRVSWSSLDGEGHRLKGGDIFFDLEGKTSQQINDILGRVCAQVIHICREEKKPLGMEDLDLVKKAASLAYGSKKANRGTRMFAYRKMTAFLEGKALREGVGIIKVNPAFTSVIGKVKYMKGLRLPIHDAASMVIGRRAMGFREKVPAYLMGLLTEKTKRSHYWRHFSCIMRLAKKVPARMFRRELPHMDGKNGLKAFSVT